MRIAIHQEENTFLLRTNTEAPTLVKIQEASERLNNQQKIKDQKISRLQAESEELLFMPTINKKSKLIGRSRVVRSTKNSDTTEQEMNICRMKTPTKTIKNIDQEYKVTPIRKRPVAMCHSSSEIQPEKSTPTLRE